jgi:hypothetical protein
MKRALIAVAVFLSLAVIAPAQQRPRTAKPHPIASSLEVKVRKLWEAFKGKDKKTLAAMLDDNFRLFEEGLTTFGDKQAEVNAVDDFELVSYRLSDFTVKLLGPNSALVTYLAEYEGKSGGQSSKAKSVFGEVWIRAGNDWKALYMQETYVK